MIAAVIFIFIDVKEECGSRQQQPCYFCYDHFLTVVGLLWLHNIMSQHHCGMSLHEMLFFFHKAYMLSSNHLHLYSNSIIYFWNQIIFWFESMSNINSASKYSSSTDWSCRLWKLTIRFIFIVLILWSSFFEPFLNIS